MDAVEYVKQRERMCDYYVNCGDCPAGNYERCASLDEIPNLVPIVEKWAKEHVVKTRQDEFFNQWPNAEIGYNGLPSVAPCQLDVRFIHGESQDDCKKRGVCNKCRCDFWLREVE